MITPSRPAAQTVAVGFVATGAQLQRLGEELGDRWTVTDICDAPRSVDVVLVSRCSPQAVLGVRREFPMAQVVVVEAADEPEGPDVCRCLSAGSAAHVVVRDVSDLVRAVTGLATAHPTTTVAA